MKQYTYWTIFFLSLSNLSFAQIKGFIIDQATEEGVPYVNIWIENKNIGTTSDDGGLFILEEADTSSIIVFSAVGYQTQKIRVGDLNEHVIFVPISTDLQELVIYSNKKNKTVATGSFNPGSIKHYFACGTSPWMVAKYFPYQENYQQTPFLKTIKMLTDSDVKDAKFNIRLYFIGEDGAPKDYIYHKNIYGIAAKGKGIASIDVSDLNILFPKEGFFIVIEWLIIEQNKHIHEYRMKGSKKKQTSLMYEPNIGTVQSSNNENTWVFRKGAWERVWKNTAGVYKDFYSLLAIELVLTD